VKKLFGDNDIEAVLQRLDRLTQDEARTTAAQTLEVVYGLVQNMRVVIDSKRIHLACQLLTVERFPQDGKASTDKVRESLGAYYCYQYASSVSDSSLEIIQDMASEMNKSKRQIFCKCYCCWLESPRLSDR
jgi:hypothetical protein